MRKITGVMIFALMVTAGFGNGATVLDTVIQVDVTNSSWYNTGIDIQTADRVYLFADFGGFFALGGQISGLLSMHPMVAGSSVSPAPDLLQGPVMKIGSGAPRGFRKGMCISGESGTLYLGYNDDYGQNSGYLFVGVLRLRGFSKVEEKENNPAKTLLKQNRPNPSYSSTTIEYSVPKESKVSLMIYNETGQLVKTLLDEMASPGNYSVAWNGIDNQGKRVSSGTYFYMLNVDGQSSIKKAIVLK